MRTLFVVLVAAAVLLFVLLAVRRNTEAFDNTGALIQLASSHVPTEEDVEMARNYRRQVQSDLIDMTGSA